MKKIVWIALALFLYACTSELSQPDPVPMVGSTDLEERAAIEVIAADAVGTETAHIIMAGDYSAFLFENPADRWDAIDDAAWGDIPLGPPAGYYDDADESSATALRDSLHLIISSSHTESFDYTHSSRPGDADHKVDVWDITALADESPTSASRIIDLYRNAQYTKQFTGAGSRNYDREHVWPKSFGFKRNENNNESPGKGNRAYVDCHHLFPARSDYNMTRSNRPFGPRDEDGVEFATIKNFGRGGSLTEGDDSSNWAMGPMDERGLWEVWLGRRGDAARAIFYMDVRYEGDAGEAQLSLTNTQSDINDALATQKAWLSGAVAFMGLQDTLIEWHEDDPVDEMERRRNSVVFLFQGNRNPFIDHPEWVAVVYAE